MSKITITLPKPIFNGYKKKVIVNQNIEDKDLLYDLSTILNFAVRTVYHSEHDSSNDNIQEMVRLDSPGYNSLSIEQQSLCSLRNTYYIVNNAEFYFNIICNKHYVSTLTVDDSCINVTKAREYYNPNNRI